ncbi:twin-arginine translocation signal domain-containing protein [Saliphagus sp. LR7]|uniref:twin-arginine translocation signal domain-containing protein n=1 Tax=Saliphagus sp. LR7 TaxID=2282654 RepID=UPI0013004888|nr:twin-arginine translocation signal domain-containing protein [Saliphagus sp. LR7]
MPRQSRTNDTTDCTADDRQDGSVSRRRYLKTSAGAGAVTTLGLAALSDRAAANPTRAENQRSGDDDWLPTAPGGARPAGTHPEDINHHVEGYPSQTSVAPAESLDFHVSTAPAADYRIDVYRLGWYGGAGGRRVASLAEKEGEQQSIPDWDAETGLIECDWPVTDTLNVDKDWTSGAYMAKFVATSGEYAGESTGYVFAVREREDRGRNAKMLVQLPNATSQAYNGWGGKSLYNFTSAASHAKEETGGWTANIVSHDRPIGGAPTNHMRYAIHAVRFLEREGYDVSYVMDDDVHQNPEMLQNHEMVISAGHDEYWSMEQRNAFEDARDEGTNLGFFGANSAFWQVRYEDDGRTMIGYKENVEDDPLAGTQNETDLFRSLPDPRPECELLGVMSVGAGLYNFPDYTVQEEAIDHPWMEDTGFEAGDTIVGCIGHEWDWIREDCEVPGELTNFFHYEEGSSDLWVTNDQDADSVAYKAPSGAQVFSTGTMGYTWRIDPDPAWNDVWPYNRVQEYKPAVLEPDERLQQFTRNALDDLRKPNPPGHGGDPPGHGK